MEEKLYSVDQVASMLGLHVRTVRGYVRDGRLHAVRIGKQYRIAQKDLDAFTGRTATAAPREPGARHVDVSSIVEIDAISPETASRLATLLMAATANRSSEDQPLRLETAYDEERARMKVIVLGGLGDTAGIMENIEMILGR
ncbi:MULTISPECIES: helix-turn-helix domain-containing protein [Amycolatopsis]|uniref:Helix-turn-helix domain-containing protein n=1 Tax=Amycolatopsis thermalba TaxID=944492 RepID=A0ABY4NV61_9PSEU|nr:MULTISPECIES: helix-turn-helix domain-containing protein [Amycolatopsis]OXM72666.1 DNA-binding protein [Amycolatopsis sp. KNN50.9b]UQS23952.1 helix-turn-helix domain-containing protein [Amycolatopsis thermalba]